MTNYFYILQSYSFFYKKLNCFHLLLPPVRDIFKILFEPHLQILYIFGIEHFKNNVMDVSEQKKSCSTKIISDESIEHDLQGDMLEKNISNLK